MKLGALVLLLAITAAPQAAARTRAKSSKRAHATKHHPSPRSMAPERATAIEKALVAAGYLHNVSGTWSSGAAAAMKKYQADHHWQTRFVPDARALIALGLGPPGDKVAVETPHPD